MDIKKVTSVTYHNTAEGGRLSYTYSVIDGASGTLKSTNNRADIVLVDGIDGVAGAKANVTAIMDFVTGKMEE